VELGLTFISLAVSFGVFFISLSIHEFSHAYASFKLGDPTAKYEGRMTLNPLAHIDLIGTVVMPIFLSLSGMPAFGWAKPVHVNIYNFKNPARDNFITAIAGPASNFVAAFLAALIMKIFPQSAILELFVMINVVLGVFNLLPIPPLDGSKIWHLLLSDESYFTLERLGPVILISVLLFSSYFSNFLFSLISFISSGIINIF
jgi:Zn-dependent protease